MLKDFKKQSASKQKAESKVKQAEQGFKTLLTSINSIEDLYSFFDEVYKLSPNCTVDNFIANFKKTTEGYYPMDKYTASHYFSDRNYPLFGDKESKTFPTHQELYDFVDTTKSLEENVKDWYGYKKVSLFVDMCDYEELSGAIRWVYDIKLNGYDLNSCLAQLREILYANPETTLENLKFLARKTSEELSKIKEDNISYYKYELGIWQKYYKSAYWRDKFRYNSIGSLILPSQHLWDVLLLSPDIDEPYVYRERLGIDSINSERIHTLIYYKFNGMSFREYLGYIINNYRESVGKKAINITELRDFLFYVHGFQITCNDLIAKLRRSPYLDINIAKGIVTFNS